MKLRDHRLNQSRDRERVVHARLCIAHAHLQCVEEWMQPDVPPDFLRVIDATSFDQQFAVIFVLRKAFERVWNPGAWKAFEHFESITFQARVLANPER